MWATTMTFKSHQMEPRASQPQQLLKHLRIYLLLLGWYLTRCQERQGHLVSKWIVLSITQREYRYMCTLIHTHTRLAWEQSYVTKTNKKDAASKNSNCPLKAGEIKKCGRRPAMTPIPHTASHFDLSSLQNCSKYTTAIRSVSAPPYKASVALSAPLSSASLNSHSHIKLQDV